MAEHTYCEQEELNLSGSVPTSQSNSFVVTVPRMVSTGSYTPSLEDVGNVTAD